MSEGGPEAAGRWTDPERTPFDPARWFRGGRFDFLYFTGALLASEMGSILSAPERKLSARVRSAAVFWPNPEQLMTEAPILDRIDMQ
jgi:hypothetical protein